MSGREKRWGRGARKCAQFRGEDQSGFWEPAMHDRSRLLDIQGGRRWERNKGARGGRKKGCIKGPE